MSASHIGRPTEGPDARGRLPLAAVVLTLAGFVMAAGSFAPWGSCPLYPCGAEFGSLVIVVQSGAEFGPGIATALLGAVIAILGVEATRPYRRPPMGVAVIASVGALGAIVLHLLIAYASADQYISGPYFGLYATAAAVVVALPASARLRILRLQQQAAGLARRRNLKRRGS